MELNVVFITENFNRLDEVISLAKDAFPPEEYLSPNTLIEMSKKKEIDFWALYDDEIFVGFMAVRTYKEMSYLFFLAIFPLLRSHGYGGKAIRTLKELYPDMQQVVDLEMLDPAASNYEQRKSRRSFYLRNGYRETEQFLSYLGVEYEVLCMDEHFHFSTFKELMDTLPLEDFCPRYFSK